MNARLWFLIVVVGLVVSSCSLIGGDDADTDGFVRAVSTASSTTLSTGDCFDDNEEFEYEAPSIVTVACASPHDNEIYAVGRFNASAWPGDFEVEDPADTFCLEQFAEFIGLAWEDSDYDYISIVPTEESWGAGDRDLYCFVYDLDLDKVTGSLRGIGA
jgi:hypothetical protein